MVVYGTNTGANVPATSTTTTGTSGALLVLGPFGSSSARRRPSSLVGTMFRPVAEDEVGALQLVMHLAEGRRCFES